MASSASFSELNTRHGISGISSVVAGSGGLPKVVINSPQCSGEIYLHGGHVTSWAPKGEREVFYLSPNSQWLDGRAIRGGVPVCFPWFGDKADDPTAPAHGFVRTKAWDLESIEANGGDVKVSLGTESSAETSKWWPHEFRLVCRATFGAQLKIELTVSNTGASAFSFEEALHAYFRVGDVEHVAIRGLDSTRYIDKVDQRAVKMQSGDLRITAETDRVYLDTEQAIELTDTDGLRLIRIHKQKSRNTVLWNPWAQKAASMHDLGAGEWKSFVCVETANAGETTVRVDPGQSHSMTAFIEVAALR